MSVRAAGRLGRRQRGFDYWPGFVDALSGLLLVIIFLILVFVLSQFFLNQAIAGKDAALAKLTAEINTLGDMLALERNNGEGLEARVAQLAHDLDQARQQRSDELAALQKRAGELQTALAAAGNEAAKNQKTLAADDIRLAELMARQAQSQSQLASERQVSSDEARRIDLLNRQIAELRDQLDSLAKALDLSEARVRSQDVEITDLGRKLNVALAQKLEELARYRSEFFGRLRDILGKRSDIRVVGDRFVFSSEVLFEPGAATLGREGRKEMTALGASLKLLEAKIPKDLAWVLRVDGHTDRQPIHSAAFKSNWELSTARALTVVKYLIAQGITPAHLAATGFAEFQPIDTGTDAAALKRNRRIELRLTDR